MRFSFLVTLVFIALPIQAAPITWTLNNVGFITEDDGSPPDTRIVTGYFDYDADTGVYSNINLVTTLYEGETYAWVGGSYEHIANNSSKTSSTGAFFGTEPGPSPYGGLLDQDAAVLQLRFETALTNAGGTINILGSDGSLTHRYVAGGYTYSSGLVVPSGPLRKIAGGTITATGVVPIPAAAWLFGSSLAGLGWIKRKQAT